MSAAQAHLPLRAFCEELARCGLREACTSPGSRCAPIVLALVRERRISCFSHIDERCAAFFALGAAKASGRPVVITCTSGTAAANLAPAVIEAFHANVPLIVLTADRPPELRDVGAGQAIDQLKLYGDAVKWFFEVGVDDGTAEAVRFMRTLACRAYFQTLDGRPGPVHLNFPLREPLVPDDPLTEDPPPGRADGKPWVSVTRTPPPAPSGLPGGRVVVIAGAGSSEELPAQAAAAGVPVLADPLSGARRGPAAIAHYDLLLRSEQFISEHRPELVIRAGELATSKPLRTWLRSLDCEQVALDPYRAWQDPDFVVSERTTDIADRSHLRPDEEWLSSWRAADEAVARALAYELSNGLSEPLVAARLPVWLPDEATLCAASSMPIRDLESFAPVHDEAPRILANRGANGIDGTVSSAFGTAAVGPGPTVLLCGDLALLHDLGGLVAGRRLGVPLTIVVLNNDGGGIFHFLPVSSQRDAFERHVATPHGLQFDNAAALFGYSYERAEDEPALREALGRGLTSDVTTILEVRTNRIDNFALHERLVRVAIEAL